MAGILTLVWGEKSKEELEKHKRKLMFELEEVNIKLKKRNPPREVEKLEAEKRKLEFQIREADLDLEKIALRERAESEAQQRQYDQMLRENEEAQRISNKRREENKKRRQERLNKFSNKESVFEASTEVLMPCCNCVIL